jgi:hypothetical protein
MDNSAHNKMGLINRCGLAMLHISGDSREWRYLNKGTHEEADRAEFDRSIVKTSASFIAPQK